GVRLWGGGGGAAADSETETADAHVEIADDAPHGQRARPVLQRVELIGGVTAADQCAHRGADDDVGFDAVCHQGAHDADMGKTARRAAAEHESDRRTAAFRAEGSGIKCFVWNVDAGHWTLAAARSSSNTAYSAVIYPTYRERGGNLAIGRVTVPPGFNVGGLKLPRLRQRKIRWAGGFRAASGVRLSQQ